MTRFRFARTGIGDRRRNARLRGRAAASGLPTLLRVDVTSDFVVRPATMSFGASADYFIGWRWITGSGIPSCGSSTASASRS